VTKKPVAAGLFLRGRCPASRGVATWAE
jgi:hypothetical protein